MKVLHLSWMMFFISFVVWYNHAPLMGAIAESLNMNADQIKTLLILNVALAIPARVVIGMLTDKFGPKRTYAALLGICSIPCFVFAFADNFVQAAVARLLLGSIGAGFVIGIRMVSEWFPADELGMAEGIYGGWGNFGSAAAAMSLPIIAHWYGGEDGWRYAIATTGVMSLAISVLWYFNVTDTPKGSTYFKPKKTGAMEVTSVGDFYFLLLMKLPLYAALGLVVWKISPAGADMLPYWLVYSCYAGLALLYLLEVYKTYGVNRDIFVKPVPEMHRYAFKQVAVLNVLYFTAFGSEIAVVSMLPLFFAETFELDMVYAGLLASGYALMNLFSRPSGGWLSDRIGRRRSLIILMAGLTLGYFVLAMMDHQWPLLLALAAVMTCSYFVQAGEGAVFAVVPLIKRRLTGQIAGMTGAYGNAGAVVYLTLLSFVSYQTFFLFIAISAVAAVIALCFMKEPSGHITEINEDGSVELINVG